MIALVLIGLVVWFLKVLILDRPAPEPPKSASFTCDLPEGCGTIDIHIHYEPNPMEPSLEPIVRCWALKQIDAKQSPELYASLNAEIRVFNGIVKNLAIHRPPAPPAEPKQPTKAERELSALMASKECAEVLVKATGAVPDRPIEIMVQDRAKKVIGELFTPIDYVE